MDVGNVLQLTHSFGYVQKGGMNGWTSRAELMTMTSLGKAVDLMTWQPQKSPAFFCVKIRHAAPGPELETAQQEEGVQFQMDTLRKLREAGLGWWRSFLREDMPKEKDNSWVVENLYSAMAIYPPMAISCCWKKTHGMYLPDFKVVVETRRFRY